MRSALTRLHGLWRRRERLLPAPPGPASSPAAAPGTAPGTAPRPAPDPHGEQPKAEAERLIAELDRVARVAGLTRDDPMMPVMTACANAIRFIGQRTADTSRTLADATGQITAAIAASRATADAELERFRAGVGAAGDQVVQSAADAIGTAATTAFTWHVRWIDWGSHLLISVAFAAPFVLGYWWGQRDALASVHQTEQGLRAAFAGGPAMAQKWLDLMTWNEGVLDLEKCHQLESDPELHGRRACSVPLWIEGPKPATAP